MFWDFFGMSGCNRGTTAEQRGPELIIPRKFVRRGKKKNLDKTSRIYIREEVKLQLVGRDFPLEYSDRDSAYPDRLIACLKGNERYLKKG